nr:hypothetical protein Iba_chr07bCG8670 [Ipomoea batatas]
MRRANYEPESFLRLYVWQLTRMSSKDERIHINHQMRNSSSERRNPTPDNGTQSSSAGSDKLEIDGSTIAGFTGRRSSLRTFKANLAPECGNQRAGDSTRGQHDVSYASSRESSAYHIQVIRHNARCVEWKSSITRTVLRYYRLIHGYALRGDVSLGQERIASPI